MSPDYAFTEQLDAEISQQNQQDNGIEGIILQQHANNMNIVTRLSNEIDYESASRETTRLNSNSEIPIKKSETKNNAETPGELSNKIVRLPKKIETVKRKARKVPDPSIKRGRKLSNLVVGRCNAD